MRENLFKGFHPDENGAEKVFVNGEWISGEWVQKDITVRSKLQAQAKSSMLSSHLTGLQIMSSPKQSENTPAKTTGTVIGSLKRMWWIADLSASGTRQK